jgi:hypothetical protein
MELTADPLEDLRELLEQRKYALVEKILSQSDDDGHNHWYELVTTHHTRRDYRKALESVITSLENDVAVSWGAEDTGRKISMLCYCHLLVATVNSLGRSVPAVVITAAIETGARDLEWAEQIADSRDDIDVELALLSRPDGASRLNALRRILNKIPEYGWRSAPYDWAEAIAPALAGDLPRLRDLRQAIEGADDDYVGGRARALAAIAPSFPEPERSQTATQALAAARERKNTWGHAMTLLMLLPEVTVPARHELWSEFHDAAAHGALGGSPNNWEELTRLADLAWVPPALFLKCVAVMSSDDPLEPGAFGPWVRDGLLVSYMCRLAERRRIPDAYEAYRAIGSAEGRTRAQVALLSSVHPWWVGVLHRLPDPLPAAKQVVPRLYASSWRMLSRRSQRALYADLLDRALAIDGDRQSALHQLLPHLPADLTAVALQALRADADNEHGHEQRAARLAQLALVSPPREQARLIAQALGLSVVGDGEDRDALTAECDTLLEPAGSQTADRASFLRLIEQPPARRATARLLRSLDDLSADLIPLAWEAVWAVAWEREHDPRPVVRLADRMIELGDTDSAHDRIEALVSGLKLDRLVRLIGELPASLTTPRVFGFVIGRLTAPAGAAPDARETWSILKTTARMVRRLPPEVISQIVRWCRRQPEAAWDGNYHDEIAGSLVPLFASDGRLDEALRFAASITAHHLKAQALAQLAGYLPERERDAAVTEARELLEVSADQLIRPAWLTTFAGRLGRQAGADPDRLDDLVSNEAPARTLALLATWLPEAEALDLWGQAADRMTGEEMAELIMVMPDGVIGHALQRVPPSDGDHLTLLFGRLRARGEPGRFEQLAHLLKYQAAQGRPALLETLTSLAPALLELAGPDALRRLRTAVRQVGEWWP